MNVWVSFEPLWREIVFPLALIVILIHHLFRLFYIDTLSTSSHSSWCMYEHECLLTYRSCKHFSNNSQLMKIYFCISCHLISAPRSVRTPYVSVYDVQLEAFHKKHVSTFLPVMIPTAASTYQALKFGWFWSFPFVGLT